MERMAARPRLSSSRDRWGHESGFRLPPQAAACVTPLQTHTRTLTQVHTHPLQSDGAKRHTLECVTFVPGFAIDSSVQCETLGAAVNAPLQ